MRPRPDLQPPLWWARIEDAADLASIYNDAIDGRASTLDTNLHTAADFAAKLGALGDREAAVCAGSSTGVDGYGWLKRYSEREGYRFACETTIFVARAAWGTGIAHRIQETLLAEARRFGDRHVVAKIMAVNERSLAFHARFGFETVGTQRAIGQLHGELHDVVILQRLLEPVA